MTRARDVANLIGSGNYSSTTFTATAGQTVFSIAHTQNFVQVFMNGLLLDLTVDYTSNGSAVTLTSGAAAGDEIEVVAYNTFSVGDALNQAAADTRYVNTTGDTMSGDLTIDTNTFHVDVADNRVGIGTTAPTNNLTIVDGGGSAYGADATVLLDMKRNVTNSGATNAVGLRLGNNSNAFAIKYGGASDTLNLSGGSGNTMATFRNDGAMTLPYQPAFNIVGTQNGYSARITAGGTTNAIPFNLARGQGTSGFNTSNGVYTAPVTGTYLFTLQTIIQLGANHEIFMYKNGTLYARHYPEGGRGASFSSIVPMAVNDYIVFGCDFDVYLQNTTSNYSSASIALIG